MGEIEEKIHNDPNIEMQNIKRRAQSAKRLRPNANAPSEGMNRLIISHRELADSALKEFNQKREYSSLVNMTRAVMIRKRLARVFRHYQNPKKDSGKILG